MFAQHSESVLMLINVRTVQGGTECRWGAGDHKLLLIVDRTSHEHAGSLFHITHFSVVLFRSFLACGTCREQEEFLFVPMARNVLTVSVRKMFPKPRAFIASVCSREFASTDFWSAARWISSRAQKCVAPEAVQLLLRLSVSQQLHPRTGASDQRRKTRISFSFPSKC